MLVLGTALCETRWKRLWPGVFAACVAMGDKESDCMQGSSCCVYPATHYTAALLSLVVCCMTAEALCEVVLSFRISYLVIKALA